MWDLKTINLVQLFLYFESLPLVKQKINEREDYVSKI